MLVENVESCILLRSTRKTDFVDIVEHIWCLKAKSPWSLRELASLWEEEEKNRRLEKDGFLKDTRWGKDRCGSLRKLPKRLGKMRFFGNAPCGISKSLASLLAILPQLKDDKLIITFRTRNQLHIFLRELKALGQSLPTASLFSKQSMCPMRMKGNLAYIDFFEECKKLRDNCKSLTKPYCRFYLRNVQKKKEVERLALDCARKNRWMLLHNSLKLCDLSVTKSITKRYLLRLIFSKAYW